MRNLLFGLFLIGISSSAFAAVDLGKDIMKPLYDKFKLVQTDLTDGTSNAAVVATVAEMSDLVNRALATTPETDRYKQEVALVGPEATQLKYTSLLQGLQVTLQELSKTVAASSDATTRGTNCTPILKQIGDYTEIGHLTFKDPNP